MGARGVRVKKWNTATPTPGSGTSRCESGIWNAGSLRGGIRPTSQSLQVSGSSTCCDVRNSALQAGQPVDYLPTLFSVFFTGGLDRRRRAARREYRGRHSCQLDDARHRVKQAESLEKGKASTHPDDVSGGGRHDGKEGRWPVGEDLESAQAARGILP